MMVDTYLLESVVKALVLEMASVQISTDIFGRPFVRLKINEAGVLDAAILACIQNERMVLRWLIYSIVTGHGRNY